MRILSKIGRKPGEVVELGNVEYTFQKDKDGRFFVDVEDTEHAERLLSISEGFGLYDKVEPSAKKVEPSGKKVEPSGKKGRKDAVSEALLKLRQEYEEMNGAPAPDDMADDALRAEIDKGAADIRQDYINEFGKEPDAGMTWQAMEAALVEKVK